MEKGVKASFILDQIEKELNLNREEKNKVFDAIKKGLEEVERIEIEIEEAFQVLYYSK